MLSCWARSFIVGMPAALLLVKENATVTICHSRTKNLKEKCAEADVLIAAVGRAEMVKGDWIKPGAAVIDVGTNRVDDDSVERGYDWREMLIIKKLWKWQVILRLFRVELDR